jgi:NAD(P)-dependent dehydrogenase (short-subunit alcohol dehydrogenase family)
MLMTVIGRDPSASNYGELAGIRVLITGLSSTCGVDVARAFADHRGRLVLHMPQCTPENDALAAVLAETASEIALYTDTCNDGATAVRFAQTAAQTYGGLDAVINMIPVSVGDLEDPANLEDVDGFIERKLTLPVHITRVIANRMRLTLTEGLILNVMTMPGLGSPLEAALAGVARTALAAATRAEAEKWAPHGIRVNAIGPRATMMEDDACLASEPDIAAMALYLASRRGRSLTGQIFDAAGVAARRC